MAGMVDMDTVQDKQAAPAETAVVVVPTQAVPRIRMEAKTVATEGQALQVKREEQDKEQQLESLEMLLLQDMQAEAVEPILALLTMAAALPDIAAITKARLGTQTLGAAAAVLAPELLAVLAVPAL